MDEIKENIIANKFSKFKKTGNILDYLEYRRMKKSFDNDRGFLYGIKGRNNSKNN